MSLQSEFSKALLTPEPVCPSGLFSANGADPASRFAVYRNNVQSSLINALIDGYPVLVQLVGDAFFRGMAQCYVRQCPPGNPLMSDYGNDLADFIEGFLPAATVPYLADVARLERLRVKAYHAADAEAVEPGQIAAAIGDPEALARLRMDLHPSTFTLNSPYAVVALWAAHQAETPPQDLAPYHPQTALVLRNGLEVEVFAIDTGSMTFIRSLQDNRPLGLAVADAQDAAPAFNLSQCLALLIGHNAITRLHPDKVSP
ncbi:DNA-binding domain-containing protein [Pseudomonas purpurea]|uniref:DNA-binding domain-containing protein n=1 Tax=Pseudomonas purpurea TaxID=3136737 RepID=UPI0032644315